MPAGGRYGLGRPIVWLRAAGEIRKPKVESLLPSKGAIVDLGLIVQLEGYSARQGL